MVADDLAISLAERYVRSGDYVLDPFCGSGRLLAAAACKHAFCVGTDLNPLACLLTRAKLAKVDPAILADVVDGVQLARRRRPASPLKVRGFWKVEWFAPAVAEELAQIVTWINELRLREPDRILVAAALSAATRDASFARKGNWKLHRMGEGERRTFAASAWDCFARRLKYCVSAVTMHPLSLIGAKVGVANALNLSDPSSIAARTGPFDVVITSPPYGDSRTTVQYGAASALTLDVVSRIEGLEHLLAFGRDIDAGCLGGGTDLSLKEIGTTNLRRYWAGSRTSSQGRSVIRFLEDFARACREIAFCLKPGGIAVLVVGRRSTGGCRLKLDDFAVDCFKSLGLRLADLRRRPLCGKHLPRRINRFARAASHKLHADAIVHTISDEIILILDKAPLELDRQMSLTGAIDPSSAYRTRKLA